MIDNKNDTNDDFLQDLMQDFMQAEESPSAPSTQDTEEHVEEAIEQELESDVESVHETAPPTEQSKRRPLFQSLGIMEGEDEEVSSDIIDTSADQETIDDIEETVESEEIAIDEVYSSSPSSYEQTQETEEDNDVEFYEEEVESEVEGGKDGELAEPTLKQDEEIEPEEDEIKDEEDFGNDLFDSMFEDLTEVIDEPIINTSPTNEKEVDNSDVIIPLEKPGMDEVKVTADGRTLSEMLSGIRGGSKSVKDKAREVAGLDTVIEIDGKRFSDDRYLKHVEVITKEAEEQERRVALSRKFLQRNADFTEEEKIIMNNLGMSSKQLSNVMKSTELSKADKRALLGLGRYGPEKHFKGRKYKTTVGDQAMLEFLVKFKFANTRILKWISNEPQGRTWRKLNRLRNSGLVEAKTIIGIPDLWAATPSGVGVAGYNYEPGLRPMPKMITVSASLGVNYIAACLWFNTVNVLNLDDFPAHNRPIALQEDGREWVRGEDLVSELEIRSSLGKEISPTSTTMQTLGDERLYNVISSNVRSEFDEWIRNGKEGPSPEFSLGNEYMWILFPTSQLTLSYHVPDLVLRRERGPNGEPRSIAVEMERYDKSSDRYDKIMLAYKLDEHLYEKVVWITPNSRVARALEQAATNVGFENYTIIPIITETGSYDKPDIWMI